MKKTFLFLTMWLMVGTMAHAQRAADQLGRGVVVVPTGSTTGSTSNLITWRRLANEYYDVSYNLYKDGKKIATGLTTTNYEDMSSGTSTSRYQVAAVVKGKEQTKSTVARAWTQYVYNYTTRCPSGYLDIALTPVYDRNGDDVTDNYSPNDAEMADLDGDGELEMIIKRLNTQDAQNVYPSDNATQFVVIDAYDINWQTGAASLLWRIDCGPNMVSLNSTEIDIIAFDWDEDGRAEVVLRGADNMIVYGSDGQTALYTIGDMTVNTRNELVSHSDSQYAWTHTGSEYLIYMDGLTGQKYQVTDYPLKRLESNESNLQTAWGDNYGHRSSKYFFGAPYLDGRTPSLFLARGIYTRHKMMALDLDKASHQWSTRWSWTCNNSQSPWYGNGYHNFIIADVDEDGRDEIVYGSMVIDDNGRGLSATGYEHGDAQHVSDFDPWRKGLEFFGCLEDKPYYGCNYRDATTSEVLYKFTATEDDGRALMANFSNDWPGSLGRSSLSNLMSSVTHQLIGDLEGDSFIAWGDLNFRIYWDGDLCSEILNSPGIAKEAKVEKPGKGRLFTTKDCNMNNDSKNNPCFQGDIIGDWREEFIVRCGTNVRVYTSGLASAWSMPSLWYDHQYRQAMVWQMMAYNQPPHLSFFLGEAEGYTQAPPPLVSNGRTELAGGSTIGTAHNGLHLLACEATDMTLSVDDGAAPWVFTDNAPSWVQGTDVNGTSGTKVSSGSKGADNLPRIRRTYYTHTLTGGGFSGDMHLCKQGDGTLILPDADQTYTGETTVWAGTLQFNGRMTASPVTMKRFTTLNTNGGQFGHSISMEYGATLNVGGAEKGSLGSVSTDSLHLGYGSRVVIDINGDGNDEHDWLNVGKLDLDVERADDATWQNYGPDYLTPVLEIRLGGSLANGLYPIGQVGEVTGSLDKVRIECADIDADNLSLVLQDGTLCVQATAIVSVEAPVVEVTDMAEYAAVHDLYPSAPDDDYYLPVVSIRRTDTNGQAPTLSATFTALDGSVRNIGSETGETLFSEDYENAADAGEWVTSGANIQLETSDDDHGTYFCVNTGSTNTRYAYLPITDVDVSGARSYTIQFDIALKPGDREGVEFCVMSQGGTMPSNTWDNYADINNGAHLLFDLTGSANSTSYSVCQEGTATLASGTWYTCTLTVDQQERTVAWTLTDGSSGTLNLPEGTSTAFAGFYLVAARYGSVVRLDNISVQTEPADLSTYTFTEPGTLAVSATLPGTMTAPSVTTIDVPLPYRKIYESADYSAVPAADAAITLGDMWNAAATTTRWANWNKKHPTYGDQYVCVTMKTNSNTQTMFLDDDQVIWIAYQGGSYPPTLIQDFGIGQNKAATFGAKGLGNGQTWVKLRYDVSLGQSAFSTAMVHPAADGSLSYTLSANGTLQQLTAYEPTDPAVVVVPTAISQPDVAAPTDVYTLSGQLVRRHATSLRGLPKGIYIVGKRRILVK